MVPENSSQICSNAVQQEWSRGSLPEEWNATLPLVAVTIVGERFDETEKASKQNRLAGKIWN